LRNFFSLGIILLLLLLSSTFLVFISTLQAGGQEELVVIFQDDFEVYDVKVGDLIEVYGAFKGIEDDIAKMRLEKSKHYFEKLLNGLSWHI